MKFTEKRKQEILLYILQKIKQGDAGISKAVSEVCGIGQGTVHSYINELNDQGILRRVRRGVYELVSSTEEHILRRADGEFSSDTYAYERYFKPLIAECPKNVQEIWQYAFTEMMNNVIEHSEAEEVLLKIDRDPLETTVSIIDGGVGIFQKIKDYFHYESLDDAICDLFKGKLTTSPSCHSGEGIFFTSRIMDFFMITSGGKIFAHTTYHDDIFRQMSENVPGTGVRMSLSNNSNKRIQDVFDEYTDMENGFSRTYFKLRSIFDSSPVSRSQAKRICSRLGEFSKVTLDFEDIEWIGQGFAHELFVVFASANPGTVIEPIGMCESVEKMYKHVTLTQ